MVVAKMEYENTKTLSQIACHAPKLVFNVQYLGEDSRAALNRGLYQTKSQPTNARWRQKRNVGA